MARPAPAVDRAVDILDFLAEHPRDAFSLSELARQLDLNKASAHATLTALVDRGYLLRHPTRKDYRLGPRLIAVGEAAQGQYPAVEFARDELRRLGEDLGMECVASLPVGDEMVIVDRAGPVQPIGIAVAVGSRFPLVPPMGTIFMAWSSEAVIDEWLRPLGADDQARYREALVGVRDRGYSAGLGAAEEDDYRLVETDGAGARSPVSTIGAPVFDADGDVALGLFVVGFRDLLTTDQVPDVAGRLQKAAGAITESIHGRAPA